VSDKKEKSKFKEYQFKSKVWQWHASDSWYFVSLPKEESKEIKELYSFPRHGFGAIPVIVQIGDTTWETSIFPDSKTKTYIMPIKKAVRKLEKIKEGETVEVLLEVDKKKI